MRARVSFHTNTHVYTKRVRSCDRWLKNATTPLLPLPQQTTLSLSLSFSPLLSLARVLVAGHHPSRSRRSAICINERDRSVLPCIPGRALIGLVSVARWVGKKITRGKRDANVLSDIYLAEMRKRCLLVIVIIKRAATFVK